MKSYNNKRLYAQRTINDKSLSEQEPDSIVVMLKAASSYKSDKRKPSMPVMPWELEG